jgi:hypothetical protein
VVQIIGSGYTCQGSIQDTSPQKLEKILHFSTESKNEWGKNVGSEDEEGKMPTMIAMLVSQLQPMLSPLDKSAAMPTSLFVQSGKNLENPCVSTLELLPPVPSAAVKKSNLSGDDAMCLLSSMTGSFLRADLLPEGLSRHPSTIQTALSTDAAIESGISEEMQKFIGNRVDRDLAIADEFHKQGRVLPVPVELANGTKMDNTAFLSATKVVDSRSNMFIAPPPVIPGSVRDEGWHYKFRSWSGRHVVRISPIGGIDDHAEFPATTIDLSPSSELVEQSLHRARAIFEDSGKWQLKVHAEGRRQPHDLLQRRIAEEKDGA